ncbi:hypothetical protein [Microbacterium paulum]
MTGRNAFGMPLGEVVEHSQACADCDADSRLSEVSPGVYRLTTLHDPTCPWFAAYRRGLNR